MGLVTPDTGLLFWMVIIFGVVLFILAKFGFPVITGMVAKRNDSINQSLKMAEEARAELEEVSREQSELLLQAKKEQARILEEAGKVRDSIIEQAKVEAREEASKIIGQARTEIAAEKESALRDIRKEVAVLSVNMSEKILRAKLGSEDVRNQYMDRIMDELSSSVGKSGMNS